MLTWSEILPITRTILRWWWVVVCAVVLSVGTAWLISAREPRYYTARTTLQIGTTFASAIPDPMQLQIGGALVRYYGELATRQPILEKVTTRLNLPFSWSVIADVMLRTAPVSSANLLEIAITDSNPERAAAIANAIGEELIAYSPASPDKVAATQAEVERQIGTSESRIQQLKASLDQLENQRTQLTSASDIAEANNKIAELEQTLQEEESNYQALFRLRGSSVANSLTFFEPAQTPTRALPTRRTTILGMAGIAGLLLSLLAIFLLDRVDTRWRTVADINERLNLRSLGSVPEGMPLFANQNEQTRLREIAVRETHTNLLLATADRRLKSLLVTSPGESMHRAAYATDLAYLFARSGYQVLLVDADIDQAMLTDLLGHLEVINWVGTIGTDPTGVWSHIRTTKVPNLMVLPGRRSDQTMPTLVPSLRWPDLVRQLSKMVDIIIFDGAAVLANADSALLAPYVDGVVVTLDPRTDSRTIVARTRERLMHNPVVRLVGAVMIKAGPQSQTLGRFQLPGAATPLLPGDAPAAVHGPNGVIITPLHNDHAGQVVSDQHEPAVDPPEGNRSADAAIDGDERLREKMRDLVVGTAPTSFKRRRTSKRRVRPIGEQ